MIITAVAAAGCFLTAGFYFAFTATVLPALGADAPTGTVVMRSVNRWAVRPPFLVLFFGTAASCAVVCVRGILHADLPAVAGALAYLAGTATTVIGNVRLNDALARTGPGAASGQADDDRAWSEFAGPWSRLNLLRTAASAVGGALLLVHLLP